MLCYVILYYILLYRHTYSSKRRRCRLAGQTRTGVSVGGIVDLKGPRVRVWSEMEDVPQTCLYKKYPDPLSTQT